MTPRAPRRSAIAVLALAGLATIALYWAHGRRAHSAEIKAPERNVPYLDGKWIRFSPEYAKRSQLAFAAVAKSPLAPVVSVTGTVTFDPERMAAIGARITGRVRRIYRVEGDAVRAGDVLAEIESAELGQAQSAVLTARARAAAATANEKREQELAEARISSAREAELALANAIAARAELSASEQRVRALGGTADGPVGILKLSTPIAGKIIERNVSLGQSVEPTHTAFRVADLTRVWVELAVFERQLAALGQGDPVELVPQGADGGKVKGTVAYVGDVIDLETRTAPVRVVVDLPGVLLRPGQSVQAKIHTSVPLAMSLVVPRDAVASVDGKPTVFISRGTDAVEPRTVRTGGQDGDHVEILAGLDEGESVATSGVFALKSEIFR